MLAIEHVTEDVAESFRKTAEALAARAAAHVRVHTGVAVLVVGGALAAVRKHLVGFLAFLEFFLSRLARVALVTVRVMLHCQLAVSFFDVFIAGVFGDAQRVVVVFFCHETA